MHVLTEGSLHAMDKVNGHDIQAVFPCRNEMIIEFSNGDELIISPAFNCSQSVFMSLLKESDYEKLSGSTFYGVKFRELGNSLKTARCRRHNFSFFIQTEEHEDIEVPFWVEGPKDKFLIQTKIRLSELGQWSCSSDRFGVG